MELIGFKIVSKNECAEKNIGYNEVMWNDEHRGQAIPVIALYQVIAIGKGHLLYFVMDSIVPESTVDFSISELYQADLIIMSFINVGEVI